MVPICLGGEFFFATCFRQMKFFCAKNIFSSHLATMATGSANPHRFSHEVAHIYSKITFDHYLCTIVSHKGDKTKLHFVD